MVKVTHNFVVMWRLNPFRTCYTSSISEKSFCVKDPANQTAIKQPTQETLKHTNQTKEIPQPKKLPVFGTLFSFLAAGSAPKLHIYSQSRHKELGPIYQENIGPVSFIFISCPEAMRTVFAHEGKYPVHILPEAWVTYNKKHGNSRGIFFMDGEEWLKYRRVLNKLMLRGNMDWIEQACEPVAQNLARRFFGSMKHHEFFPNLEQELFTWSLEMLVSILIGPNSYQLWKPKLSQTLEDLGQVNQEVFLTTSKLSLIPTNLACKYNIPSWKRFEKAVKNALEGSSKLVETLLECYVFEGGLLKKLRDEHLDDEMIKRIVIDLVLAAGDTTSYSMEWTLYCLGKDLGLQKRICEELQNGSNNLNGQSKTSLIRNSIKESLRLYPIAPFLTRILPEPLEVLGYTIPANKLIVMSIYTSGRDEKYFDKPEEFFPDRWNRTEVNNLSTMQTASLPFAMGSRSCVGRRIAEVQMKTTLACVLRKYQISVGNPKKVDFILRMVGVPSEPINLRFKKV